MAEDREESFLNRWSRRKHAAARGDALAEPAPQPPAPPPASPAPGPIKELPSLESLEGLTSEYKDFLRPEVDPATRSAALKKLFSDPHFNRMDGLDVYIDDYSKLETLPTALLRVLNQAQSLGLFQEEKPAASEQTAASSTEALPQDDAPEQLTQGPMQPGENDKRS